MTNAPARTRSAARPVEPASPIVRTEPVLSSPLSSGVLILVIISLFFWHALWGIPGAILAVPLLAMFKIICNHVEPLKSVDDIIGAYGFYKAAPYW
jgi:hypothetical protein